jgi:ATPase MipZ
VETRGSTTSACFDLAGGYPGVTVPDGALEARRKVSRRTTDWIVVRTRLESVESSNQQQITEVLDVIQRTVGFRVTRGLLERPVYREFFATGLTVLDPIEGFESVAASSRPASSTSPISRIKF